MTARLTLTAEDAAGLRREALRLLAVPDPSRRPAARMWISAEEPRPATSRRDVYDSDPERTDRMLLKLERGQRARVHLRPVDRHGDPAEIDGVPVWAAEPAGVASVEPDEDGISALVLQEGEPGSVCTVTATVDADLDTDEETTITGALSVAVVSGQAVAVELSADAAEDVPGSPAQPESPDQAAP